MIYLLAIPALLLLVYLDLYILHRGRLFVGPDGVAFWVRKPSWLIWVTSADGTTVSRTIHLRNRFLSSRLLAHEFRHTLQQRGKPFWLVSYLLKPSFRDAMEADARLYGEQHRTDPYFVQMAKDLG